MIGKNKDRLLKALFVVLIILILIPCSYYSWRLRRWFNWKLSYGSKVDTNIEQVEQRLELLEHRMDATENIAGPSHGQSNAGQGIPLKK